MWKTVKLDDVCTITNGSTPLRRERRYWEEGNVPWFTIDDLRVQGKNITYTQQNITQAAVDDKKVRLVPENSVLLCCTASIGETAIARVEMATNQQFNALTPKSAALNSDYLYFVATNLTKTLISVSGSTTVNFISMNKLKEISIPLPPIQEQRRIAAILDKADAIRRKRQDAISLADEFLRSTFLKMFGDPITNPRSFMKSPINVFGDVTTGNTPRRNVSEYYGGKFEWIKSDNINTPHHYLTKAEEGLTEAGRIAGRSVKKGSILVTCIAGSFDCIGNAAIADREVAFNQQINAITPFSPDDTEYIYAHLLVGKKLIQNASTKAMKGMVSKGKFQEINFLAPPAERRKEFGAVFRKVYSVQRKLFNNCFLASNLFDSLSQRAFRGGL